MPKQITKVLFIFSIFSIWFLSKPSFVNAQVTCGTCNNWIYNYQPCIPTTPYNNQCSYPTCGDTNPPTTGCGSCGSGTYPCNVNGGSCCSYGGPGSTPNPGGGPSCAFDGCSSCGSHPGYYFSYNPACSVSCTLGCNGIWPSWLGDDAPGYVNTNGDNYVRTPACQAACATPPPPTPIDGICSPNHYNCVQGTLGGFFEYPDQWQWWCMGANNGINILCPELKPTPPPPPTCTISLSPGTTNLTLGGGADGTITATVSCTAPVDNVTFSTSNPAVVSITSANPDTTASYTATVHGVSTGAVIITGTVYSMGAARKSATAIVNSTPLDAWFQVKDADVYSGGDLNTNVVSPNVFGLPGIGTFPGVPTYTTSTDLVPSSKVSTPQGWIAKNTAVNQKVYNYQSLVSQIPADVVPTALLATVTSTDFNASTKYYDYYWYKYSGGAGLPLTINGNVDFTNKKVILLVDNANLVINGNINVTDGQGFFMVLVKGNITVASTVGGTPPQGSPNLEGIYEADGTFNDSVDNKQLWVRGSVVAYGGATLDRDLVAGNFTTPAELFEFAPDQLLLYPSKLGARRLNWKEVAP